MVHALASPVLAHLSVADMLTVGAPLSREVGDCFLSCSGNFSRDIFFGGWKVAGPLPRRRVGSCPTPLRGGGLHGHVTIAPYSPKKGSASLNCSIYYNFPRELRRIPKRRSSQNSYSTTFVNKAKSRERGC